MPGDDGIDQISLQTAIFGAQNGTVSTVVGLDVDFLRRWLDTEQYHDPERFILLLDRIRTSSLHTLLDQYVVTLADTAERVWPAWYGADLSVCHSSASGLLALHARLASLASQDQRISLVWARKAVSRVLNASSPTLTGFDSSEQIRQLGLTLHRRSLIFVLGLTDEDVTAGELRSFAQSTHWLALHGGMAIVVLLPARLGQHPALETILYGARTFVPAQQEGLPNENANPPSEPSSHLPPAETVVSDPAGSRWLWPLIGRPHPLQPGRAKARTGDRHRYGTRAAIHVQPTGADRHRHAIHHRPAVGSRAHRGRDRWIWRAFQRKSLYPRPSQGLRTCSFGLPGAAHAP